MAKRSTSPTAWRDTPAGIEAYRAARAEAQARANEYGYDHGMEPNDFYKSWRFFMLPPKHYRYGHETQCEVVMCEDLDKCRPGHGPLATRPPSVAGPDYHGGPWVGRERALELDREWWLLDEPLG